MAMSHVELRNVAKSFDGIEALKDITLAVGKGEFFTLLGPSGCGKSTLLRVIAGLEDPSQGEVYINGVDVTGVAPSKREVAMVFQSYALYPHLTVRQNIAFSLNVARAAKSVIEQRVDAAARALRLEHLLHRRPAQLSGGQRQRVAIGRALVRDPEVFLFDEPLSNLDAMLRVQMRLELGKLHRDLGATMIYVTHDQVEAMTLSDRIAVLDRGAIAQIGSPLELFHRPANKFVASFIGSPTMNFVNAAVRSCNNSTAVLELNGGISVTAPIRGTRALQPGAVEMGIRPAHIRVCAPGSEADPLPGTVRVVEQFGTSATLYLETCAGPLVVESAGEVATQVGDTVGLLLDPSRIHLFDTAGTVI
jgi:multiple sugar transport system ATP-binding protein